MRTTFWIKALCIIPTFINNYTYSYAKPTEKRKYPFDVVVNSDVIFWRQEASYNEWRFVCISGAEVHPKNKNKILNPPHQISIYDSNPKKIKELFAAVPDSVKKCPDSVYVNSNVTTKESIVQAMSMGAKAFLIKPQKPETIIQKSFEIINANLK
jgi:DNA-binding NarL/FixJ family response regulator